MIGNIGIFSLKMLLLLVVGLLLTLGKKNGFHMLIMISILYLFKKTLKFVQFKLYLGLAILTWGGTTED